MLCVGLAVAALSGCAAMIDAKSKQLEEGLGENDVKFRLGEPNSVSLATCGSNSANGSWQCRQYIYNGGSAHRLIVYFAKFPDGTWHVNNWSVL
jgi:hypothetical protein